MEENETYMDTNDTMNDDVIECDAETIDTEDESTASGVAALAGLVGLGVAGGIAIHKWVMPAIHKGVDKAKEKIAAACMKKNEHYVIEDAKEAEVEESEKKDTDK